MEADSYLTVSEKEFLKREATRGLYEAPAFHFDYVKSNMDKLIAKYGKNRISSIWGFYIVQNYNSRLKATI